MASKDGEAIIRREHEALVKRQESARHSNQNRHDDAEKAWGKATDLDPRGSRSTKEHQQDIKDTKKQTGILKGWRK